MWFFGKNPLQEALKARKNVELVYIAEGTKLPAGLYKLLSESGVPVKRVPREKIDRIAGNRRHGGVGFRLTSISLSTAEEILDKTIETKGYSVFLDRVQDPQNAGNIIRSAYLLGATGVLVSAHKTSPFSNTVVKASAGAAFFIPVARVSNPISALLKFQKMGGYIVSFEASGDDLRRIELPFPCVLVLGGEGTGIRHSIIKHSDLILSIPISGKINSLNVASAGAIALFKALADKEKWTK